MKSQYPYLPPETIRDFTTSVKKAVQNHPNPTSDANLKEMERLAKELEAEALRRQRAHQAEAGRAARAYRSKLEVDQRREDARVARREPGDFSSEELI